MPNPSDECDRHEDKQGRGFEKVGTEGRAQDVENNEDLEQDAEPAWHCAERDPAGRAQHQRRGNQNEQRAPLMRDGAVRREVIDHADYKSDSRADRHQARAPH